jgi:DNA-binding transcriptional ArsR family regulator
MSNAAMVQPRFARIAAAIGDPTRSRMLAALMDGAALPAGEIARAAGVNPSTASGHLAKLVDEGLVAVHAQGRHRYYRVRDGDVAQALEALSIVAERSSAADKWLREPYRSLRFARTCYRHIAGELGVQLLQALLADGRLAAGGDGYQLTAAGHSWLRGIGMEAPARSERYAFACLDWSERRYHLAGRLATSLLDHFMARHWLSRVPRSRALRLTPTGRRSLTFPALA